MRTVTHVGKEANSLEDLQAGLVQDVGDVLNEYDDLYSRVFVPLVLPVLPRLGVRETARRTGTSPAAVSRALSGRSRPRSEQVDRYVKTALEHASTVLLEKGSGGPDADPDSGRLIALAREPKPGGQPGGGRGT